MSHPLSTNDVHPETVPLFPSLQFDEENARKAAAERERSSLGGVWNSWIAILAAAGMGSGGRVYFIYFIILTTVCFLYGTIGTWFQLRRGELDGAAAAASFTHAGVYLVSMYLVKWSLHHQGGRKALDELELPLRAALSPASSSGSYSFYYYLFGSIGFAGWSAYQAYSRVIPPSVWMADSGLPHPLPLPQRIFCYAGYGTSLLLVSLRGIIYPMAHAVGHALYTHVGLCARSCRAAQDQREVRERAFTLVRLLRRTGFVVGLVVAPFFFLDLVDFGSLLWLAVWAPELSNIDTISGVCTLLYHGVSMGIVILAPTFVTVQCETFMTSLYRLAALDNAEDPTWLATHASISHHMAHTPGGRLCANLLGVPISPDLAARVFIGVLGSATIILRAGLLLPHGGSYS